MNALAWLLVGFAQEIPDHPDKIQYPPLKFDVPDPQKLRTQLPNGTIVYAIEDRELPLVQMQFYIRTGSFWEPKGKEGVAELCGTVMRTGGTKKQTPQQVDEELDFLAAELGVSVGDTSGAASLSILSKNLDRGLEILFDVLFSPEFLQQKIDLAKAQMMDRIKARNDSTSSIESREANLLLYGADYPVNRLPTKASIESITRADLLDFHQKNFVGSEMILAVAGDFQREELLKKLQPHLPEPPRNRVPRAEAPPVKHVPTPGVYGFSKEVPQGRVTLAHLGIDLKHPDLHAIHLMNYVLGGGGFSSRLMQRVRTDEGLVYDVRSEYKPGIAFLGTFRVRFQSKTESCAFAIQLCLEEIKKVQEQKVDAKVVEEAKKYYYDGFPAFFFSTKLQTVQTFANAEFYGFPKDYYQTFREKIAAVTVEDLQRVAREHIRPDKFVIVCVGNLGLMVQGDGHHPATLKDFGPVKLVPLPNPETLERTK